jgi:hypothetical protein
VGLAALISRGEVRAAEVLDAAVAVADAVDPEVCAIAATGHVAGPGGPATSCPDR